MTVLNAELREQLRALGLTLPPGVDMRLHEVPVGQLPGQRATITVITEKGCTPDLSFLQPPGFSVYADPHYSPGLYAFRLVDNWDGEGDVCLSFAKL